MIQIFLDQKAAHEAVALDGPGDLGSQMASQGGEFLLAVEGGEEHLPMRRSCRFLILRLGSGGEGRLLRLRHVHQLVDDVDQLLVVVGVYFPVAADEGGVSSVPLHVVEDDLVVLPGPGQLQLRFHSLIPPLVKTRSRRKDPSGPFPRCRCGRVFG